MTPVGKRFLDPGAVDAAIEEATELARRSQVKIALAGGVAMQMYGSDRFTKDVDFIASGVPSGLVVEKRLSFGGVSGRTESGTPIRIIVRNDDFVSLYDHALETATELEAGISVVTPECLAAMKLVAGRPKDVEDLKGLIALKAIDLNVARKLIKEHLGAFAVKEFNAVVEEVEWILSRDHER